MNYDLSIDCTKYFSG